MVRKKKESSSSLKTCGHTSKYLSNSSILKINHELDSIEVNKGRIFGELSNFYVFFEI